MVKTITPIIGVELDAVYNAINVTTNPEIPGLPFTLGARIDAGEGRVYMFAQASGTIAQYACVAIDENWIAGPATTTRAATASRPGWAQTAFTDGQSGWFLTQGSNFQGKLRDGVAVNAQLYTTPSAGILGSDASTGNPLRLIGVQVAVAGSGAGNPGELIAVNPSFARVTAQA
jgi:hypothetical protein